MQFPTDGANQSGDEPGFPDDSLHDAGGRPAQNYGLAFDADPHAVEGRQMDTVVHSGHQVAQADGQGRGVHRYIAVELGF